MKLVIDIDEELYYDIRYKQIQMRAQDYRNVMVAIVKGTPLPKCHGRLIDADEAIQVLKSLGNRDYRREKGTIQDAIKMLSYDEYTPTIIEADKTESEELINE